MAEARTPEALVRTDQATTHDRLGFEPYRDTLVEVIRRAETPLTVGVFGAWGSGKTSLLLMLQDALQAAEGTPHARAVWFNAWQYNQEAALWRALISRVLEALRPPKPEEGKEPDAAAVALERELEDLQASLYRDVDREEAGGFEVDWGQLAKGGVKGALKFGLSYIPGVKLLEDLVAAAKGETESWAQEVLEAFHREKTRIRVDHVAFLEQFRARFQELIAGHVLKDKGRLVVLVDDLDRCLPEKAVEVLEAIKLFLDVEGCVFVIAVDRNVIVEGIRVKYRDFALREDGADGLPITGGDYLEKIVQLPFHLPPVSREAMVAFITAEELGFIGREAADDKEAAALQEACAEVFTRGIEANARKIKRTLNVFWMQGQLAERRAELRGLIKPVRLAKVVVIQQRYPNFFRDWVEAPLLLRYLEERYLEEGRWEAADAGAEAEPAVAESGEFPAASPESGAPVRDEAMGPRFPPALDSDLVRKWADERPLQRMLLYRAGEPEMGFAEMEQGELEAYIYLTSTSAVAEVTEDWLDERVWEDLLSDDFARVDSAVGRVREEERRSYRRRLVDVLAPGTTHGVPERVSAGTALALLGDPRAVDELVRVPAGEFLMGTREEDIPALLERFGGERRWYELEVPQHALHLPEYLIARAPVTNAQYALFLAETSYKPPRYWQGGKPPRGKENHPVVNVSWHDAMAYCRWLSEADGKAYRLPGEAEWEKAARGVDGRVYPWGDEWDAARCNSEEGGLGDTTPVGAYPRGASPFGLWDMTGNVWEWTISLWGEDRDKPQFGYPYDRGDGRENLEAGDDVRRVLRGGAFLRPRDFVRCALRYRYNPSYLRDYIGFRIVVAPLSRPSSG